MSNSIINLDGSVTYRGKTFRLGDEVTIHRNMNEWSLEEAGLGGTFPIQAIDRGDDSFLVLDRITGEEWYISFESTFEFSEEEEAEKTRLEAERKPWDMPELKPWMRVTNHNSTYIIVEVEGKLIGARRHGWEELEVLKDTAIRVFDVPRHAGGGVSNHFLLLESLPDDHAKLLWDKEAAMTMKVNAEKASIQAEIDALKLKTKELEATLASMP